MKNTNSDEILKKLQEQQTIENILKRKDIEHEALVEAAKKSINNPNVNIKQEKDKIVKDKIKEKEEIDRKRVEEVENRILDAEIDELLKIYNEQERLASQKRKLQVELILSAMEEELDARKRLVRLARVDKMVKQQANKFRVSHARKQNKLENFVHQLKIFEAREKIKRDKEKMMQEEKTKALEEQKKQNTESENLVQKGNGNENSISRLEKNDALAKKRSNRTYIEGENEPKPKRKIHQLNYKMLNAIKKYTSVMEFYERNKYILHRKNEYRQRANASSGSFKDNFKFAINHKEALSNAEKNKGKTTLRPRIIE